MEKMSDAYLARCHKTLRSWGAPLTDWYYVDTYDVSGEGRDTELATCELCGCTAVRFVHVMEHADYFENLSVGCICAGIMEGDVLAAKERERLLRNRMNRRTNFMKRKWRVSINGNQTTRYKGQRLTIIRSKFEDGGFGVVHDGLTVWRYKNRKIRDFQTAARVAFDLVDPPLKMR